MPNLVKIDQAVLEKSKLKHFTDIRTDGRTDGQTDDGQNLIRIAHLSLQLR